MGHFASVKNVKKIQVLCFQCFRKLSKFAYLRPSDFYFEKVAFLEGKIALFVLFFQQSCRACMSVATPLLFLRTHRRLFY